MNLEEKRELLLRWKRSGLSLPKWWKENAEEMDLPHLSTLYDWAKKLGFTTEPGAEVTNERNEDHEEHSEQGDSDGSQEEDDEEAQGDSQGKEENDEKEIDEEPEEPEEEDVIAKDRIEQLAPSTVPEPAQPEKALDVDESKPGIKPQTWVIIGGAVVLGIGAYLLARKIVKRREPKPEQNTMPGGNPFAGYDGYITIDDF